MSADTKDMNMRYLTILIIISGLLLVPLSEAFAWRDREPVTPYGDFCPRCSQYGICKSMMSSYDAEKAMVDYYNKKGFDVEIEDVKGRFIKAKIKDKDNVVDVIIFDRRTGRIRSIY
jgi:hypothetical protein